MASVEFQCRLCKKITVQMILVVTDLLPYGTKVIQCTKCEAKGVAAVGEK